ncbi:MAG: alkaline phosphatase D family protein [Pirellulaceae bacterium]|nr:alkaline phosphatase D family protein [Pirellulaceae bacterium]
MPTMKTSLNHLKYCGPWSLLVLAVAMLLPSLGRAADGDLYIGSGVKAGEITDRTANVLVRLTTTAGQDGKGLIPGRNGQAKLRYGIDKSLSQSKQTNWEAARPDVDHSIQFKLTDLEPARRYFYHVEFREGETALAKTSEVFSFVTAPAPDQRAAVMFHLTTCQDIHGESTYRAMAEQHPDFCVSAGDTVYYDGQGLARTIPQAWQAYQKMFGLPAMKDYYANVGGYFMKDDHDYRFNDSDPYMKGKWVSGKKTDPGARLTETKGDKRLDEGWLTHEEGIRIFKQVFPMNDKTNRTVRWGKGLQVWMLENRDFRSPNDMPDGPEKSIWGKEQKAWLMETLLASDADYRVIISPNPIIGPDRLMKGDNHANLNGFWTEAQTFLDWLKEKELNNVILMCGDRHWQYHSTDRRNGRSTSEFSCGPTCDEHVQAVPPIYDGVERPYSASRGGFMSVRYQPTDRSLAFDFHSVDGKPLYQKVFTR